MMSDLFGRKVAIIYRKEIDEVGVFHKYGVDFLACGEGAGIYTTAIIELPNGEVRNVQVENIRFMDKLDAGSCDCDEENLQIIKVDKVIGQTTLSRSAIFNKAADLDDPFPAQIKLSERSAGWLQNEVTEWIRDKAAESMRDRLRLGQIRTRGADAFRQQLRREENPYHHQNESVKYDSWNNGYSDAKNKFNKEAEQ